MFNIPKSLIKKNKRENRAIGIAKRKEKITDSNFSGSDIRVGGSKLYVIASVEVRGFFLIEKKQG